MRILFVNPSFPTTYWGMQHAMPLANRRATLPPLGLITVAAMLPEQWQVRLVDANIELLEDHQLQWADVVLTGGMRIQADSMHEIIGRARDLGRPTVVGGPAPTTGPDEYVDADVRFLGEAESKIEHLVAAIENPDTGIIIDARDDKPDLLAAAVVPRYDLLDLSAYSAMSLQYSRGCPFRCEFCDIIEIFGRRPRVKSADHVLAELDALYRLGRRGSLFFVDDNFIGNKPAVRALLPKLTEWQRARGFPFNLYTEASLNLAGDPVLMTTMVEAGFSSVFLGIETPSISALQGAGKTQNLRLDPVEAVDIITRHGLEIMGGFIVGFDEDDEQSIIKQRDFIMASPIPLAMVGLLTALPGTALHRRLAAEGRLRGSSTGDAFIRPNFEPAMNEAALLRGYADLLAKVYDPDAYYDRCEDYLDRAPRVGPARHVTLHDLGVLGGTLWKIGVRSPRRRRYWKLLWRALTRARHKLGEAVAFAVQGEHMIRYTREQVLPRIERSIADVDSLPDVAKGARCRVVETGGRRQPVAALSTIAVSISSGVRPSTVPISATK